MIHSTTIWFCRIQRDWNDRPTLEPQTTALPTTALLAEVGWGNCWTVLLQWDLNETTVQCYSLHFTHGPNWFLTLRGPRRPRWCSMSHVGCHRKPQKGSKFWAPPGHQVISWAMMAMANTKGRSCTPGGTHRPGPGWDHRDHRWFRLKSRLDPSALGRNHHVIIVGLQMVNRHINLKKYHNWLVVLSHILWKIKNVWNHQPDKKPCGAKCTLSNHHLHKVAAMLAPPTWPGAAALVAVLVAQYSAEASQWNGHEDRKQNVSFTCAHHF